MVVELCLNGEARRWINRGCLWLIVRLKILDRGWSDGWVLQDGCTGLAVEAWVDICWIEEMYLAEVGVDGAIAIMDKRHDDATLASYREGQE